MRQSEDDMDIGKGQQFPLAASELLTEAMLGCTAMPVTVGAGICPPPQPKVSAAVVRTESRPDRGCFAHGHPPTAEPLD
jgi:hypothetical protein